MVRKKNGIGAGGIYAMKIIKKSLVIERDRVTHVKSEQEILHTIHHPFIVSLR